MKEIEISTKTTQSIIRCGKGAFEAYAPAYKDKQTFIVTDSNVFGYYRHLLWRTFGDRTPIYILPAGESSKTFRYLREILQKMIDEGMRRNGYVIAVGGGVVGDIAGLAASLYMRGIHLVQIPTTLLAQVDSSVGGKTAIDCKNIKNVIGSFYQPEEVIVDPVFLETLPDREIRCGLGEIIKYGALDKDIYSKLTENEARLKDPAFLEDITYSCINHKANVVRLDERETTGLRKTLNLGHTTGHAFELYYRKKSHGEFVLIGMYYELYIAEKHGVCGGRYAENLKKLILKVIKKAPAYEDVGKAAAMAKYDKKNAQSMRISMVVPGVEGKSAELTLGMDEYIAEIEECAAHIREGK